jgi:hypothetical protein
MDNQHDSKWFKSCWKRKVDAFRSDPFGGPGRR